MKVKDLIDNLQIELVTGDLEKEIKGLYCCDLLSWVIANASEGDLWVTVMNNVNIIAVASLADVACIALSEGVEIDDSVKSRAIEKDITILKASMPSAQIIIEANKLL